MPTWGAVGLGSDNADTEPDEIRSMYDETLGLPPKAPYLVAVKSIKKGETGPNSQAPGTPKIVMVLEIAEPPGTVKAKYNGYAFFIHRSVTEEGAGRINRLLKALLGNTSLTDAKKTAVLKAFWDGKVVYDKDTDVITKIGTWTLPDGMMLGVTTRKGKWEGDDTLEVDGEMSPKDAPKGRLATEEDEEAAEDADDEESEGDEEDPEVAARAEELAAMTVAKLKTVAKGLGAKLADYKSLDSDDLVEFILDLEFPVEGGDDEEDPDETEEGDEDETEEEGDDEEPDDGLDEMSRAELKAHIKAEGLAVRVTTKMSDEDIVAAIRALDEDEAEDEPEEDEEPEPPAKTNRRSTAAAKPAPKGRPAARRRVGKDEPPF